MGIGAAVVLDGVLAQGRVRGAGEIGFLPVPGTRGLPSATDCEGGFHSLAGAGAVLELAGECGVLGERVRGRGWCGEVVRWAVANSRDASAVRFLDTLADRLALGVASVVALLDPGAWSSAVRSGRPGAMNLA